MGTTSYFKCKTPMTKNSCCSVHYRHSSPKDTTLPFETAREKGSLLVSCFDNRGFHTPPGGSKVSEHTRTLSANTRNQTQKQRVLQDHLPSIFDSPTYNGHPRTPPTCYGLARSHGPPTLRQRSSACNKESKIATQEPRERSGLSGGNAKGMTTCL